MTLYFKNVSTDGSWNNVLNWFTDDACTTQAANVPWVAGDVTYLAYDLTRSSDSVATEDNVFIDAGILAEVTGTCDIGYIGVGGVYGTLINNNDTINGGTFSAVLFYNYGTINGGTFSGDYFNNSGTINGGTFSGDYFTNYGPIYGGTFSGVNFTSNGAIYGGTFSGDNFYNYNGIIFGGTFSGDYFNNNNTINGGLFSGDSFTNDYGAINGGTFSGDYFTNNIGTIYGGTFSGDYFNNNNTINGGTFSGDYFTDYNVGPITGGTWLESGVMDVAWYDYDTQGQRIDVGGYTRITGRHPNPYPQDLGSTSQSRFTTLRIAGQDVLGGGLL